MQAVTGAGRVVAGRYKLLDPIGSGSVGTVWRALDLAGGGDVAVKGISVRRLGSEKDRRILHERALREARVAAKLSHPGVVSVYDVFEADGSPWIVMELVRARSLAAHLASDGPMTPRRAAEMGNTLVGALACAHAAGVVHRDVKPANVLVADDGRTVLTDFGIAMIEGDPCLTQVGMVMGTPGFCAPERIRGEPASPASDLWSLGATLYAAVEGYGPFDQAGSAMAVLASIVYGEAPEAGCAGPLGSVITALMNRKPEARPSATAAGALLAAAAAGKATAGPASARPGRHRRNVSAGTGRTGTGRRPLGP